MQVMGDIREDLLFKQIHRITVVSRSKVQPQPHHSNASENVRISHLVIAITSSRKNWSTGNVRPERKHETKSICTCHTAWRKEEKDQRLL